MCTYFKLTNTYNNWANLSVVVAQNPNNIKEHLILRNTIKKMPLKFFFK